MIFRTSKRQTLPKAEESFFSDLLVVGGGCSGLAAIAAAADLGIENSLLLEKEEKLGGRLGKSTEGINGLFAKTVQPKELLAHFSLFLENYGVAHREGVEGEELYLLTGEEVLSIAHSQDEASAYRYLLKAKTKEGERFFISKAFVLATGVLTPEENAAVSTLIEEDRNTGSPGLFLAGQSLAPAQSIAEAVQSGGAVGRQVGEMLLKEKHKQRF